MQYTDLDKYATQRGRYLTRSLDHFSQKQGEALGYCERGYAWSAIAKRMDSTTGTIGAYIERAIALYGFEVAERKIAVGEDQPDYERVDPTY